MIWDYFRLSAILLEKVLITGSGGLLGSRLASNLSGDCEVISTHYEPFQRPNFRLMDVVDRTQVFTVVRETSPDAVVHTAAATNVDKCETDRGWALNVNSVGTRNVAEACASIGARLIYVSTDYVFDGLKGLYEEEDEPNPVNYYGLTKLQGENYVRETCENHIIARTSVVYGWNQRRPNFATWVVDSLRNRRRISVVEDHYNSPTLADELAEIIRKMLHSEKSGVYHVAGGERISRHGFALKIAETFGLDCSLVVPVKMAELRNWIAKRPQDSSLCIDKLRRDFGIQPLDVAGALSNMKEQESGLTLARESSK
jgi:dTDP-4-dehydrorhamnose reductase